MKLFGKKNLAAKPADTLPEPEKRKETWNDKVVLKSVSQARQDIASWKTARLAAQAALNPRRSRLQAIYDDILVDAHLTAMLENRLRQVVNASFVLKDASGEPDEALTTQLRKAAWYQELMTAMCEAHYRGTTVVEFYNPGDGLKLRKWNRRNIEPRSGMLLLDETDSSGPLYREAREYKWWILEFGDPDDLGLLNKAVPHVLIKRFAQSCWSELGEIYGIPPRYVKTNTQDPVMLSRAESMMRDMGAAAWFIIDDTEELEFADQITGNGDVYNNLMRFCNNELSLLVNGAVIGQDTENGNRSKEETSVKSLMRLIESDKVTVESFWAYMAMPALQRLGVLPEGYTYEFEPTEDLDTLWARTKDSFTAFDVDPDWLTEKFGVKVLGAKQGTGQGFF